MHGPQQLLVDELRGHEGFAVDIDERSLGAARRNLAGASRSCGRVLTTYPLPPLRHRLRNLRDTLSQGPPRSIAERGQAPSSRGTDADLGQWPIWRRQRHLAAGPVAPRAIDQMLPPIGINGSSKRC